MKKENGEDRPQNTQKLYIAEAAGRAEKTRRTQKKQTSKKEAKTRRGQAKANTAKKKNQETPENDNTQDKDNDNINEHETDSSNNKDNKKNNKNKRNDTNARRRRTTRDDEQEQQEDAPKNRAFKVSSKKNQNLKICKKNTRKTKKRKKKKKQHPGGARRDTMKPRNVAEPGPQSFDEVTEACGCYVPLGGMTEDEVASVQVAPASASVSAPQSCQRRKVVRKLAKNPRPQQSAVGATTFVAQRLLLEWLGMRREADVWKECWILAWGLCTPRYRAPPGRAGVGFWPAPRPPAVKAPPPRR